MRGVWREERWCRERDCGCVLGAAEERSVDRLVSVLFEIVLVAEEACVDEEGFSEEGAETDACGDGRFASGARPDEANVGVDGCEAVDV